MPALLFEVRDRIAYLTINRPEVHNAMSPEVVVRMAEAWQRVAEDNDVRAAIITGAGNKAFSAGADLARTIPLMTGARQPEDEWDRKLKEDPKIGAIAMMRGWSLYKPVIAAVNGFCIAGGLELMQATDLRVAAESASFALQEVKWAIIPAAGSLVRLVRQMPYCKAMEILLTGNRITAAEAWRLGLVNYVVPQQEVMAKAEELARTIAENGPLAVRAIKETVEKCSGLPFEAAFKIENDAQRVIRKTEDAREGPRAFIEKRKPELQGTLTAAIRNVLWKAAGLTVMPSVDPCVPRLRFPR
ncbi:MAG TPA: enoyl-CoA hydratase-related protein [Candidatus Binataceae bacterium]